MGLINETNQQYYVGTQSMIFDGISSTYAFTWDTNLALGFVDQANPLNSSWQVGPAITNPYYQLNNFFLETSPDQITWTEYDGLSDLSGGNGSVGTGTSGYFSIHNNVISFFDLSNNANPTAINLGTDSYIRIRLKTLSYGNYAYITIDDIINNFLVAYVGQDKLIPSVKRTDVMFHAKRGLQEFSYDTLKSIKSQELTIPPSLSIIIPQDYVNYVKVSWVDKNGVTHIIYPTRLTTNPYESPIQDSDGIPIQDSVVHPDGTISGDNIDGTSITEERWGNAPDPNLSALELENYYGNMWPYGSRFYGQRYGLNPETAQINGWFTINERDGKFSFSSNLVGKLIILEYISDGLAYDGDTRVPKMAEEALYMHIVYSILATRARQPEYVVRRYKKERRAALRNAKIRLQNIKLEEITQVMRGKSKQIK